MLEELLEQSIIASEKARFIEMIVNNQLKVQNVPGNQLAQKLWELKFLPQRNNRLILLSGKAEAVNDGEVNEDNADEREAQELLRKKVKDVTDRDMFFKTVKPPKPALIQTCYQFLLRLAIQSMTKERFEDLQRDAQMAQAKYEELKATSIEKLWLTELAALDLALNQFENNLLHNVTIKPISISPAMARQRYDEVMEEMKKLPDATPETEAIPVLTSENKKAAPSKKPKETQPARPKLLSKKAEPVENKKGAEKTAEAGEKIKAPTEVTKATQPKPKPKKKAALDSFEVSSSEEDIMDQLSDTSEESTNSISYESDEEGYEESNASGGDKNEDDL